MIPLAKDTRAAIGTFADKVENRSLLFEKMALAKRWGHEGRFNDANRFNVLRASNDGAILLGEDRDGAQRKANRRGRNAASEAYKAKVAGALAGALKVDSPALLRRQTENANHLLELMEKAYQGRVRTFVGTLGGRLLVNMAGGVMENAGIALDRCFGLPFIPGSAVKGIARNQALWDIHRTNDRDEKVAKLRQALLAFGFIGQDIQDDGFYGWAAGDGTLIREALGDLHNVSEFKGLLSFLPARPTSEENLRIVAEVITPHPQGKDPRPLFFPAVEAGSSFGFVVVVQRQVDGVDADPILNAAQVWLQHAITQNGVGAKTAAGYGWFEIDQEAEQRRRDEMERARQAEEARAKQDALAAQEQAAEAERLAGLSPEEREKEKIIELGQQDFAGYAKAIGDKQEHEQRAFLSTILDKAHRETRKRWKRRRPELWGTLQSVAQKLNIELP